MEGSLVFFYLIHQKLVGFKFSPTIKNILFAARCANAPVKLENVAWGDSKRDELRSHSQTGTFPYLETSHGNLSESNAIISYLIETYKPELLGSNSFERAQVRQWVEFACNEIVRCSKGTIYPIFGFLEYNKAEYDKAFNDVKEYLKLLNKQLEGKQYVIGANMTLADIVLYFTIRWYFELLFVENLRKTLFPNVTNWLVNISNTENAMKVYGRLVLCKVPAKFFVQEKKVEEKPKKEDKPKQGKAEGEEEKPKTKKVNELETLPPTSFDLDGFKKDFLNTTDKKGAMERFWQNFDPNGFSFWWMEYQKLPSEGKVLFKTNNSASFFLQKIDNFRKYTFAVHGVYGVEGDYQIRGLWMWRGTDIPEEIKSHDSFPYMTMKKLDPSNEGDRKLIEQYWLNT